MEHAGAVVPVGEDALGRPALAHDVVQAERLQLGQRGALGRRDVGLTDVGLGSKTSMSAGAMFMSPHTIADCGPAPTIAPSAASQASL